MGSTNFAFKNFQPRVGSPKAVQRALLKNARAQKDANPQIQPSCVDFQLYFLDWRRFLFSIWPGNLWLEPFQLWIQLKRRCPSRLLTQPLRLRKLSLRKHFRSRCFTISKAWGRSTSFQQLWDGVRFRLVRLKYL
mgnify:CR=1 FL=1